MTEIEATREMSRTEVANYLREFAAQLETEGIAEESPHYNDEEQDHRVTFMVGNDSATVNPSETVTFGVEVDSDEAPISDGSKHRVDFGFSWEPERNDGEDGDETLEIK